MKSSNREQGFVRWVPEEFPEASAPADIFNSKSSIHVNSPGVLPLPPSSGNLDHTDVSGYLGYPLGYLWILMDISVVWNVLTYTYGPISQILHMHTCSWNFEAAHPCLVISLMFSLLRSCWSWLQINCTSCFDSWSWRIVRRASVPCTDVPHCSSSDWASSVIYTTQKGSGGVSFNLHSPLLYGPAERAVCILKRITTARSSTLNISLCQSRPSPGFITPSPYRLPPVEFMAGLHTAIRSNNNY